MKTGNMNQTEQLYANRLEVMKRAGEIIDYKFESQKLRLADNTFYTPDFFVLAADMTVQFHEVKGGFIMDDAAVKIKVAAEQFPFYQFFMWQYKKKEWKVTEY